MPEFLDVFLSRAWSCSPEAVRDWPADDVERALMLLDAEGKATKARMQ